MSKNTNIYITCLVYDQTHSFKSKYTQIYTQLVRKVPFGKWYPCMLHNHFIGLHPLESHLILICTKRNNGSGFRGWMAQQPQAQLSQALQNSFSCSSRFSFMEDVNHHRLVLVNCIKYKKKKKKIRKSQKKILNSTTKLKKWHKLPKKRQKYLEKVKKFCG